MTKFFLAVYDYFSHHKWLSTILLILSSALFAALAANIRFKEDISRFLPENKENERINNAYQYAVGTQNKITIYCSAADTTDKPLQIAAIETLVNKIREQMDSSTIQGMLYAIDPAEMMSVSAFITENMPYFLDEEDFERMDSLTSRSYIAAQLATDKRLLTSMEGMVIRQNLLADPLHISAGLMHKLQNFQAGGQYSLYEDHIFSDDGKALLLIDCAIPSSETSGNEVFLDKLKTCMAETETEIDGISFESFGAAEIALGNARQIQRDTAVSILLAVVLVFALLIYAFRSAWKISLIFISVAFGGLFALAMMYLLRGDVSIIAVGISSIMFGIAINYPLHFIDHHQIVPNSRHVIKDIISPLTIGNITTVGAFLSLVFIGSEAMCDLGWFASLLLVGTILFVLFFMPHLLRPASGPTHRHSLYHFFERPFENNRRLVLAVVVLTIILACFSGGSRFETDMQKINYMTDNQKQEYDKMMGMLNKNHHVVYYVSEGANLEDALQANEDNLLKINEILHNNDFYRIAGIGNFYPSKKAQAQRIERWQRFWGTHRDSILTYMEEEAAKLGFSTTAFGSFKALVEKPWEVEDPPHFDIIKETLAKNYIADGKGKHLIINLLYIDPLEARAIESQLNTDRLSGIAFDAGSITRRMISSLSDNFNYVLFVCGFIVFAFLIFSMGRIELSLIAFVPLTLSWFWILGLMNIFDMRFNIVNIILATFIFGQGDDYTIFMTEGLMYEYAYKRKTLATYKNSIALSALIMFVGMGMLIFAKHPALHSLAEVTVVGMLSVVLMAYIFPPLLFRLLTLHKGQKRLMPVTLRNFLNTAYAFAFFLIASTAITIVGWFMFTFGRTTLKKKMAYHQILHRVAKFVIYRVPNVKTHFENNSGERFDTPNIVICNHQSHLDLMCVMMLTPKLIVLTNDWVWHSPFYGKLIRYADFYPGSEGVENILDKLGRAVDDGFSIVVFPEGTRSADCSILRFHRGAFYLAEKLGLDIVPVMIHGVGHVLPKQEFMLRKGEIHIQVMPRIAPGDLRFGQEYGKRSREVRHYYQMEYEKMCRMYETPDYYVDLVIHNYIYKGPEVEREVRRNLRRHNNYKAEIAAMPDEGEVTLDNTGYGEYPLLLSLVKKKLQITASDPDPDKVVIAANCASVPKNLAYRLPPDL